MPGKAITYKKAEKAMETVAAYMKQGSMADMKTMAKSTYAEAKKKNPNLDKLIEKRKDESILLFCGTCIIYNRSSNKYL